MPIIWETKQRIVNGREKKGRQDAFWPRKKSWIIANMSGKQLNLSKTQAWLSNSVALQ